MNSPQAIVVAGPNGAGKTTFARQLLPLLHPGIPFFNLDELQLREQPRFQQPIAASREFLQRVRSRELSGQSFALETTLASKTYVTRVRHWQSLGYRVVLHFIELPSADFAVSRVAARVAAGGHDIPESDIRRRFERGRKLFFQVYKALVPEWYHWHSDSQGIVLVASNDQT